MNTKLLKIGRDSNDRDFVKNFVRSARHDSVITRGDVAECLRDYDFNRFKRKNLAGVILVPLGVGIILSPFLNLGVFNPDNFEYIVTAGMIGAFAGITTVAYTHYKHRKTRERMDEIIFRSIANINERERRDREAIYAEDIE